MARENQGLQIALIIFVMLTIMLGVTTFMFFNQSQEAALEAETQRKAADTAKTGHNNAITENTSLREMLGFDVTLPMADIRDTYNEDKDVYGDPNASEDDPINYRLLLEYLNDRVAAHNSTISTLDDDETRKQAAYAARISELQASVDSLTQQLDQANAAEKAARAAYEAAIKKINDSQITINNHLIDMGKKSTENLEKASTQIDKYRKQIKDLYDLNEKQKRKLDERATTTFEIPDGEIRWVNQGKRTVWINLGRADRLMRQITFSVYPADITNLNQSSKKASIEVIQLLGDHSAEARILEDSISDPIMPGDKIHTHWTPGEQKRFALAGKMDIDGDGRDDLEKVRNLITMNGGLVDCYYDEKGEISGKVTISTRYLVLGKASTASQNNNVIEAYSRLVEDAERFSISQITLADLLKQMGWKRGGSAVTYGAGSNPNDFRAKPPEGGVRKSGGNVSELFKPRRPPNRSGGTY